MNKHKMPIFILLAAFIVSSKAYSADAPNLTQCFKDSRIIITGKDLNPYAIAGCYVLKKEGSPNQFIPLASNNDEKLPYPSSKEPFHAVYSDSAAGKELLLKTLNLSLKPGTISEILVNRVCVMYGPEISDIMSSKDNFEIAKIYLKEGYDVFYIKNHYCSVNH